MLYSITPEPYCHVEEKIGNMLVLHVIKRKERFLVIHDCRCGRNEHEIPTPHKVR